MRHWFLALRVENLEHWIKDNANVARGMCENLLGLGQDPS